MSGAVPPMDIEPMAMPDMSMFAGESRCSVLSCFELSSDGNGRRRNTIGPAFEGRV